MTREEVFEVLNEIFQDVFDDDEITVSETTTAADIDDWDSLEHITLIAAIEQKFSIKFDIKEVNSMESVGIMVDSILKKL